jgi:hypothetical protein
LEKFCLYPKSGLQQRQRDTAQLKLRIHAGRVRISRQAIALLEDPTVSITIARTRAVYDLLDVQEALERSRGRSPELEAFYERMLDTGPERFVTTPSSLDALDPLFEECPNFDDVLDDLARYLRLAHAGNKGFNVMPILLLGGPGVGKTHFAKRLARAMGTECELISMNALSAGFVITGSSASWRGARCGKVAERLVRGQYANPVVVLDEVEKASGSSQSDPLAALYQLLEPETSKAFRDEFIDVEIDASQIFWVLTANSTAWPAYRRATCARPCSTAWAMRWPTAAAMSARVTCASGRRRARGGSGFDLIACPQAPGAHPVRASGEIQEYMMPCVTRRAAECVGKFARRHTASIEADLIALHPGLVMHSTKYGTQ